MSTNQPHGFMTDYLASWTATDTRERRSVIERLWSSDGTLSTSSPALTLHGVEQIAGHIGRVHDDLIAVKGLAFVYDQEAASGEVLLLRWSMIAPTGDVVGRGIDTITFTPTQQIADVHMFMGIA